MQPEATAAVAATAAAASSSAAAAAAEATMAMIISSKYTQPTLSSNLGIDRERKRYREQQLLHDVLFQFAWRKSKKKG